MKKIVTMLLSIFLLSFASGCRIESWTRMDAWYPHRRSQASDCKWLCDHVSEGCVHFVYSPQHDGVCHTYRCHEEECVIRKVSNMNTWYGGARNARESDCTWYCGNGPDREVCVRSEFSEENNGMCTLYSCEASPPPPARSPRWRDST